MTNNPRTYPPKAGQLDSICKKKERERRDLNAQRHECTASISTSIPIPTFGEGARHARGRRPVCRCVCGLHYGAEYFIHKPSNYRIPRTCGARKGRPRSRLRTRAYHTRSTPRSLQLQLREAQPSVVNETHPRSYVFFHSASSLRPFASVFLCPSCLPPHRSSLSTNGPILTFCTPTEMAIRLPTERVSRETNSRDAARQRGRSCREGDDPRPRFEPVGGRRIHAYVSPHRTRRYASGTEKYTKEQR